MKGTGDRSGFQNELLPFLLLIPFPPFEAFDKFLPFAGHDLPFQLQIDSDHVKLWKPGYKKVMRRFSKASQVG